MSGPGPDLPAQLLHPDQVDDPFQIRLPADGQLQHQGLAPSLTGFPGSHEEIGPIPVQFVDIGDARHAVAVSLVPNRLGLRLHAPTAQKDHHRPVQDADGALDLGREIHVARLSMMLICLPFQ